MRSIREHADFQKLTQLTERLYVRALLDDECYPLYDDDLNQTSEYPAIRARLLVLQETYQHALAAVYQACGQLPVAPQLVYAMESPFQVGRVSYLVFSEGVVVNVECQEGDRDFERDY